MRLLYKFFSLLMFTLLCTAAPAAEHGTPAQAEALLAKGVSYIKANGDDKAMKAFMDKQGAFVEGDLYLTVIDLSGKTLVHPFVPRLIGKGNLEIEDADGKKFYKERVDIAKAQGHGRQEYTVLNPVTKELEHKVAFFEKVGDVIITAGAFK